MNNYSKLLVAFAITLAVIVFIPQEKITHNSVDSREYKDLKPLRSLP